MINHANMTTVSDIVCPYSIEMGFVGFVQMEELISKVNLVLGDLL
jgi:hypothetical protein